MTNTTQIRAYIESQGLKLGHVARGAGHQQQRPASEAERRERFQSQRSRPSFCHAGADHGTAGCLLLWPGHPDVPKKGGGMMTAEQRRKTPGGPAELRYPPVGPQPGQLGLGPGHPADAGVLPHRRPHPCRPAPAALPGAPQGGGCAGAALHRTHHLPESPARSAEHRSRFCRPLRCPVTQNAPGQPSGGIAVSAFSFPEYRSAGGRRRSCRRSLRLSSRPAWRSRPLPGQTALPAPEW